MVSVAILRYERRTPNAVRHLSARLYTFQCILSSSNRFNGRTFSEVLCRVITFLIIGPRINRSRVDVVIRVLEVNRTCLSVIPVDRDPNLFTSGRQFYWINNDRSTVNSFQRFRSLTYCFLHTSVVLFLCGKALNNVRCPRFRIFRFHALINFVYPNRQCQRTAFFLVEVGVVITTYRRT